MLATASEFFKHFKRAKPNTSVGQNWLVSKREQRQALSTVAGSPHRCESFCDHLGPDEESSWPCPPEGLLSSKSGGPEHDPWTANAPLIMLFPAAQGPVTADLQHADLHRTLSQLPVQPARHEITPEFSWVGCY